MEMSRTSGHLRDVFVGELLGEAYAHRYQAVLHLLWASMEKIFWFRDGVLIAATSSLDGEHVLDFLLPDYKDLLLEREESLRQAPLDVALARLIEAPIGLPPEAVQKAMEEAASLNLGTALTWFEGDFYWDHVEIKPFPVEIQLSIPRLLWKMLNKLRDVDHLLVRIGSLGKIPKLRESFYSEATEVPFTPEDAFFISQIDGVHSIDQINQIAKLPGNRLLSLVFLLHTCGWLELMRPEDRPKTESFKVPLDFLESPEQRAEADKSEFRERVTNFYRNIQHLTPEEIFTITRDSTWETVDRTYQELMETYDKGRCDEEMQDLVPMIEAIRERVEAAYQKLKETWKPEVEAKEEPEEEEAGVRLNHITYWRLRGPGGKKKRTHKPKPPPTAERSFDLLMTRAMEYIQIGDNYNAAKCLEGALELKPDHAEAYYLLGTVYENHPRLYNQAVRAYFKAHELEPSNVLYLSHLVGLLYRMKQLRRALRYAEKLAELEPANEKVRDLIKRLRTEIKKSKE